MRILRMSLLCGLLLSAGSHVATADLFSIHADLPLYFSPADPRWEADSVSGLLLGFSLPGLPGLGLEQYRVKLRSPAGERWEESISMLDASFTLPVPFVNVVLGVGVGRARLEQQKKTLLEDVNLLQGMFSVGWPFGGFFDAHMGVYALRGDQKNYALGGQMITLGLRAGF